VLDGELSDNREMDSRGDVGMLCCAVENKLCALDTELSDNRGDVGTLCCAEVNKLCALDGELSDNRGAKVIFWPGKAPIGGPEKGAAGMSKTPAVLRVEEGAANSSEAAELGADGITGRSPCGG